MPSGLTAGAIVTSFYGLVLLEAPLLAWSERFPARWISAGALGVVALSCLLAACASTPWTIALALALYGPACGCANAVAEGLLVERGGTSRERAMARVTLAAALGDLAVPVVLSALALVGLDWRVAFGIAALVALGLALRHALEPELAAPVRLDDEDDDDEGGAQPSWRESLRVLSRHPTLFTWTFAGVLVGLLDEVLVAFAAVHLAPLGPTVRAVAVAAWIGGGLVGLAWLERRVEHARPRRILLVTAALATSAMVVLALAPSPWISPVALAIVGLTTSTFHPLVKARAYAALPGRPALVNAAAALVVPIDALAPLALGALALVTDDATPMLVLALAPAGIGVAAWCVIPRDV